MLQNNEFREKRKIDLNEKVKKILIFVGFVMAGISAIVYLTLVIVLVVGFEKHISKNELMIFLLLGIVAGLLINMSLRKQGRDFARNLPEVKELFIEINKLKGESKNIKLRPVWVYEAIDILRDILIKGASAFATLYFTISIIVDGLGDVIYILTAISNLTLFTGFGFVGLTNSYDKYLEREVPRIKQEISKLKELNLSEREIRANSEKD